eukprot:scaffold213922_cov28-Tisochrysis_lutea.AAC.1
MHREKDEDKDACCLISRYAQWHCLKPHMHLRANYLRTAEASGQIPPRNTVRDQWQNVYVRPSFREWSLRFTARDDYAHEKFDGCARRPQIALAIRGHREAAFRSRAELARKLRRRDTLGLALIDLRLDFDISARCEPDASPRGPLGLLVGDDEGLVNSPSRLLAANVFEPRMKLMGEDFGE